MTMERDRPAERMAEHHRHGSDVAKIGYPIDFRHAKVVAITDLTARMVRVTVGGPELRHLHTYQCDDHLAIVLADPDGSLRLPVPNPATRMLDWPRPMPPMRKYTIRRFDRERGEVDLDVVRHDDGLVMPWLASLTVGDDVPLAGPPGSKAFPRHHEHYVFVVDLTALPAAARWLEESPAGARTTLLVLTDDPSDRDYPLQLSATDTVTWLPRAETEADDPVALAEARRTGASFVFAAGEAGALRPLRRWAREHAVPSLVTGYWKRGSTGVGDLDD